jgi:hypothetical protein
LSNWVYQNGVWQLFLSYRFGDNRDFHQKWAKKCIFRPIFDHFVTKTRFFVHPQLN